MSTNTEQLLREALKELLDECEQGIATCPLTRAKAKAALTQPASQEQAQPPRGDNLNRQAGRTTNQMLSAPPRAVYVWCSSDLYYPIGLARALGRTDLRIERPSWLEYPTACDARLPGLVIDHAAELTQRQLHTVALLRARGVGEHL